ncbi:MAG: dicarboxylate/amino acid:cation symporter [Cobetia sp.]|uniref:Dicarboxylate/amino acid:cation symporter n=2 Tax=Cobetia TaxID=204286 RepID=A0AAP4TUS7_9GAMM|nr:MULTISPECIES: dicarboxylate/amino acid:cation symporter [Cobetia]MBR9754630.1 dicarboxylate/amino acid:cation symporter [Gammaproteobacteria bacterium]KPM77208.1 sodium:dicarboxylate symporter [Cobetia sp. UCD-24C]MBE2169023.1 dicarboxylate/amino acid:cation symporter [Cobetia sp. 2AS1]MBF10278.1 dicarboxylate/amino acid:cation symporter [Cobetia sp.]MBK10546.1 dicarboxylate/amino acid:cation symporter [Cobetia sp.]|tara:strand:+ start:312 stop:1568 length:1257 start_codon:yes stop_codon:yes gene_type:complete
MSDSSRPNLWRRLPLWQKILGGLALGVLAGALMGESASMFKPLGDIFINAIKMLIVPLVFSTLVVGITSMRDPQKMGRIGGKTIALYLLTTAFAIAIGMLASSIFQPGAGFEFNFDKAMETKDAPSLVQILVDLVPSNPIDALANGNIMQIIVFAIGIGISLIMIGDKGEPVVRVFDSFAEVMYKLTEFVMAFAPFGVFGLMAHVSGNYGLDVLLPLAKVIGVAYLASIVHVLVVYSGLLATLGKLNPVRYLRGIVDALVVAFSSASSSGTLPISIRCAQKNLGVSEGVSGFVLPVGATINMDGTAIYQGVVALFIAQMTGIELSMMDYGMIVLTGTLASIGTAGVPGAGLIMLSIVLSQVGLPLEAIAVIAGIDRILDMARTTVNVAGDLMVTTLVGKSENELDLEVYNATQPKKDA